MLHNYLLLLVFYLEAENLSYSPIHRAPDPFLAEEPLGAMLNSMDDSILLAISHANTF